MKGLRRHLIHYKAPIRQAMSAIDTLGRSSLTLFVLNDEEQMIGTVTDGDIRRGLLKDISINEEVNKVMNGNFSYLNMYDFKIDQILQLKNNKIFLVPFLDKEKKIIKIIDISEKKSVLPADAVLMAGGEGKRLRPLTEHTPKPLLKVGEKPIIEYNIDRFASYGIDTVHISVKYLGQQIVDYFGKNGDKDISIEYVWEDEPLGTIGALSLIKEFKHEYVIVMNSDILTTIDFEDMFITMVNTNADMVVATSPYEVQIPYGVIETSDQEITSLKEKPVYTFFSNAGIYMLKKKMLDYIKPGQSLNATDLIELLISTNHKVINYPILNYWLDIGKPEDFEKAQSDVKHLFHS
jgi:dTDP-glucose pyrophosphorylase